MKSGIQIVMLIVLASVMAMNVSGQGTSTTPSRSGRTDKVQRELERQFEMKMLEQALMESSPRHVKRYPPLVLDKIREDFLQIQVVDRKLTHATAMGLTLDLELVAGSAGEIRKRSSRLKENLALPRPEAARIEQSGIAVEATRERLRISLVDLSKLIDKFVSNPMFEHSRLVDPELSEKARQDNEAIIELSRQIKRNSKKLKALEKSP